MQSDPDISPMNPALAGTPPAAAFRRLRASRRRQWSTAVIIILVFLGFLVSGAAGAVVYFWPVLLEGYQQTGQVSDIKAAASAVAQSTAAVAPAGAAFTVLPLGSDDDSKFPAAHVLTHSLTLLRGGPSRGTAARRNARPAIRALPAQRSPVGLRPLLSPAAGLARAKGQGQRLEPHRPARPCQCGQRRIQDQHGPEPAPRAARDRSAGRLRSEEHTSDSSH